MWLHCLIMADWTSDKHRPKTGQSYFIFYAFRIWTQKGYYILQQAKQRVHAEQRPLSWGDINQLGVSRKDQSAEREGWNIWLEKERWEPVCLQKQSKDREWMSDDFPDPLRLGCNSSILFMGNFPVTAQCIPLFLSYMNVSLLLLLFFNQICPRHQAKSPIFESVLG